MTKITQYFNGLNLSALPQKASEYVTNQILTDDDIDLLDETDEDFVAVKELIEIDYPNAIGKGAEPKKDSRYDVVGSGIVKWKNKDIADKTLKGTILENGVAGYDTTFLGSVVKDVIGEDVPQGWYTTTQRTGKGNKLPLQPLTEDTLLAYLNEEKPTTTESSDVAEWKEATETLKMLIDVGGNAKDIAEWKEAVETLDMLIDTQKFCDGGCI
jgi:hypothetical protein